MPLSLLQTQLLILVVVGAVSWYIYPEYAGILLPAYLAAYLFFTANSSLSELFEFLPVSVTNFIIDYKIYIIAVFAVIAIYHVCTLSSGSGSSFNRSNYYRQIPPPIQQLQPVPTPLSRQIVLSPEPGSDSSFIPNMNEFHFSSDNSQ